MLTYHVKPAFAAPFNYLDILSLLNLFYNLKKNRHHNPIHADTWEIRFFAPIRTVPPVESPDTESLESRFSSMSSNCTDGRLEEGEDD